MKIFKISDGAAWLFVIAEDEEHVFRNHEVVEFFIDVPKDEIEIQECGKSSKLELVFEGLYITLTATEWIAIFNVLHNSRVIVSSEI